MGDQCKAVGIIVIFVTVRQPVLTGCDVNQLDAHGESAIVIPISSGDREVVEMLLLAGCKLNGRACTIARFFFCFIL